MSSTGTIQVYRVFKRSFSSLAILHAKFKERVIEHIKEQGKGNPFDDVKIVSMTYKLSGSGDKIFPLNTETDFQELKKEFDKGRSIHGVHVTHALMLNGNMENTMEAVEVAMAVQEEYNREKIRDNL